ncbi:MAG: SDR family oxidoreductase [Rhodospirillales bacterium]|nr:SDR family oxidoreductase [Rhodospirillales bacterium]
MPAMLDNKTIIVVGGGGLIGKEITRTSLEHGATVVVASRSDPHLVFEDLSKDDLSRLHYSFVDITNEQSVVDLIDSVASRCGKISAIVNCAYPRNANYGAKFEDVTYQDFCENVNLHLGGTFLTCQKATAYFEQNGGGNIINFSSIYGVMAPRFELYDDTPMTKEVEYIVSKSAIIHLTKYLAKYLSGKNIRVNCISPGGVLDGQVEIFLERYNANCLNKGMLDGEDIAATTLFMLSDMSRHINGQNIVVDDGFTL